MRHIQIAASKLSPLPKYNQTHQVFRGYWKNESHQREFFQWFAQQHKFNSLDDWYNVTTKDIYEAGGATFLNSLYKGSLIKALTVCFPHHDWKLWKFRQIPRRYWAVESNVRDYLQWLSEQLAITKLEDWHSIDQHTIPKSLVTQYGSVSNLLKQFFPGVSWKETNLRRNRSKAQDCLVRYIRTLFPHDEVKIDYRHPKMLFEGLDFLNECNLSDSQYRMELDIYVPIKDIAFEYHGEQHYKWHYLNGDPTAVQKRDQAKRDTCKNAGITLIEIPFWWDRNIDSLIATIHQHRPDLVHNQRNVKPISNTMPSSIAAKFRTSVSTLLTELAKPLKWNLHQQSDQDVSNFHVTKLMGGLRVHWDGKSQLVTLNGSSLSASKAFLETLPKFAVDAELHCGVNSWFEIPKMLQSDGQWNKLAMYVLDMPDQSQTFESRLEQLRTSIHEFNKSNADHPCISVELAQFHMFFTKDQLLNFFAANPENGVLLRRASTHYVAPNSLYIHKEISSEPMLVIGHNERSLQCKKTDGTETKVEANPTEYPIGDVIVTKWQKDQLIGINHHKNITWDDVIKDEYLPYRIGPGKPLGGLPKCRACHRTFTNREEPRLHIKGLFTPADAAPYPVSFNVCLTTDCITKALDAAKKRDNIGYYFPPFNGKIGVPSSLKSCINSEELQLPGTEFVIL